MLNKIKKAVNYVAGKVAQGLNYISDGENRKRQGKKLLPVGIAIVSVSGAVIVSAYI